MISNQQLAKLSRTIKEHGKEGFDKEFHRMYMKSGQTSLSFYGAFGSAESLYLLLKKPRARRR